MEEMFPHWLPRIPMGRMADIVELAEIVSYGGYTLV